MADKEKPGKSKRRQLRKPQSVRERAEKSAVEKKPRRRLHQARATAAKPFKAAASVGRKEYYLPLPDNRAGRFLNKRRKVIPSYFRNSWIELRQVVWPDRKTTAKLTLAVFLFAIFFTIIITTVDYGLDKLFKKFILS